MVVFGADASAVHDAANGAVPIQVVRLSAEGIAAQRYDAQPGTVYLLRPDQHVCARWRAPQTADVSAALQRALALA